MLIHALAAQHSRLKSRMGVMRESRLMPLARAAVSSWSALKRPKTSSVAVSSPIGSAKIQTNGINRPMASSTLSRRAWPLTSMGRISLSTLPMSSTNVNTATVRNSEASTSRVR